MKIVITENSASIEGRGNMRLLLALLTKGIVSVMIALIQSEKLSVMQAGFIVYQCVHKASEEVLDMAMEDKENG